MTRPHPGAGPEPAAPVDEGGRMSLVEHLRELRNRMFKAVLAVIPGAIVGWVFYEQITQFLLAPACAADDPIAEKCSGANFAVIGLLAGFNLQLTVSGVIGLLLASPVWLYQLWAFVTPGLHRNERRWTLVFLGTSIPLFFSGAAMCYWVFPRAVEILQGFTPTQASTILPVDEYLSIFVRLVLVFGLSFELPVFLVLLNFIGLLPARRIVGAWRFIILGCVLFGAVATPTGDPFTMLAVAVPMLGLVVVAWLICWIHDRRQRTALDEPDYEALDDDATSRLDTRPSRLDDD